ncbi:MAG: histidine phosphatase family protein [Dehalococcoidia bacterium]|uniref:histidine phosphatase family protein n=1 Tax=Candidatus Amarobacter glycogenicus TaxID=3140699 RepID=UPI0031366879|nr:histidine phosphatase family protein [Dehalococcoidia bacterium]
MRLILVRHGESVGNAAGVLQGRLDYALSDLGSGRHTSREATSLIWEPTVLSPVHPAGGHNRGGDR